MPARQRGLDRARRGAAAQRGAADEERGEVERGALHVGEARIAERRPEQRERAPCDERRETGQRHDAGRDDGNGRGSNRITAAARSQASAVTSTPTWPWITPK